MLQFDKSGQLSGAHIKTYLLEKTRVVSQGQTERGYHIGYMLCGSGQLASALRMPPAKDLAYLGRTGCLVSPGWNDDEEFAECRKALTHVGIPSDEIDKLWRVLASILLLGELDFGPAEAQEAGLADKARLEQLAGLIEVDAEAMTHALTIKMMKVGSDWIRSPNTPARASELRDGLARSMYATTFDWLVSQINSSLREDTGEDGEEAQIPPRPEPKEAPTRETGGARSHELCTFTLEVVCDHQQVILALPTQVERDAYRSASGHKDRRR